MNDGAIQKADAVGSDSLYLGGRPPEPQGFDLGYYLDIVRRYWWLMALTTATCVAAAWWTQRDDVPQYTAEVLLQQSSDAPVASEIERQLAGNRGQSFGSQVEIIRSRAVLAPVVDSLGLQLRILEDEHGSLFTDLVGSLEMRRRNPPGTAMRIDVTTDSLVLRDATADTVMARAARGEALETAHFALSVAEPAALPDVEPLVFRLVDHDRAINQLQNRLEIEEGKGPDLIWVRYTSPDPELSAAVVNGVGRAFKAYRTSTARQAARQRRQVIAEQMVQLADSLRQEQAALMNYQQSTRALDPTARGNELTERLFELENELQELQYRESLLEGLVASLEVDDGSGEDLQRLLATGQGMVDGIASLQSRLQELRTERQRLTASRYGLTESNPKVQVVDSLIASTRSDIRLTVQEGLERVRRQIERTETQLREARSEVGELPAQSVQYSRLQQRVTAVQDVFDMLVEKYYGAQIQEGVETGGIEIVDAAPVPLSPDPTNQRLNLIIAALAGLVVGGMGSATLNALDSRVRSPEDVEGATRLEVVGLVPQIRGSRESRAMLVAKEAFRGIRTNIRFAQDLDPKTIAVTSSTPGEGKSTVAANLAITLAEQGSRVVILDADLRKPQLHRMFGVGRRPGLADLLVGEVEIADVVKRVPDIEGLDVIPAGRAVSNAPALLDSERFANLIEKLRSTYTAVVFDTPPLLAVTDAGMVGSRVDGTLLVVRANVTNSEEVERAVKQLRRLDARLLGVVLNGISVDGMDGRYGYSYYDEYYGPAEGEVDVMSRDSGRTVLRRSS